jgi:hypothetical protein
MHKDFKEKYSDTPPFRAERIHSSNRAHIILVAWLEIPVYPYAQLPYDIPVCCCKI